MSDRGRYDSAMFWLAFGTAAAVIGLALMTIGVTRLPPGENLFASWWFDGGVALLGIGALLLLWALWLFLSRRSGAVAAGDPPRGRDAASNIDSEAVRGYYAERERLFKMWDRKQERERRGKS